MKEIIWTENYGIYRTQIGLISLVVARNGTAPKGSPSGYEVSISGTSSRKQKKLYRDVDEAKAAVIKMAWVAITLMKEEIDKLVKEPTK